ncbi:transcription termination factor MTEF1, chloroplastic [Mercurialis annua]|uniref:transcription termination factor MTEF1, chloroplastic n=1 Tax=Mercurialis annua TaxID=3986 RepID=UPI00215FEE01|nr:transcription termination factor MTEF1, chloroplastic [Mercurialis annua]
MPVTAATALHSTLCFSSQTPSNAHNPLTNLSAKPTKSLLHKHPLYTPLQTNITTQIQEKILCLEIMGIDSGEALSQNPHLHSASLDSIHAIISFLHLKGVRQSDLARIFGMCPQLLTSNVKSDLTPVFDFLQYNLKVPENNFRKVVNKNPRLLICSVRDQLKPCLNYLQRLGFKDLGNLAYQDSILLVSNVENTLVPKLKYLESIGLSEDEAIGMVLRCPSLFTFSVEHNFKPKFEYFVEEMKRDLEELKEFPQYFSFSLENRIKPRYLEISESRVEMSLAVMLKSTDEEFKELLSGGGG